MASMRVDHGLQMKYAAWLQRRRHCAASALSPTAWVASWQGVLKTGTERGGREQAGEEHCAKLKNSQVYVKLKKHRCMWHVAQQCVARCLLCSSTLLHGARSPACRYAIGLLFNPQSSTIAGLVPGHFVTLATPHCGCDAEGVAQVCLKCCLLLSTAGHASRVGGHSSLQARPSPVLPRTTCPPLVPLLARCLQL